jgi:ApaG protein
MPTFLTDDISVSVHPSYEAEHSSPVNSRYVFSYTIEVRNEGEATVQLLSRHWYIFDSDGSYSEIKGEGVIGEQPIINPNQAHGYQSFCNLKTDMGMMWGSYLMKDINTGRVFKVAIPEFQLITPMRLN